MLLPVQGGGVTPQRGARGDQRPGIISRVPFGVLLPAEQCSTVLVLLATAGKEGVAFSLAGPGHCAVAVMPRAPVHPQQLWSPHLALKQGVDIQVGTGSLFPPFRPYSWHGTHPWSPLGQAGLCPPASPSLLSSLPHPSLYLCSSHPLSASPPFPCLLFLLSSSPPSSQEPPPISNPCSSCPACVN